MLINEYAQLTSNTCAKLENVALDNLHMILGMLTEVGELADIHKKALAYGKERDTINEQEEIGDLMFYIGSYCRINGYNLEAILENNIKKLQTRYPEKFTKEKALNRNLDAERKVLEELQK